MLIEYVADGGNVYLAGGTGIAWFPSAAVEAKAWNTFLNAYGFVGEALKQLAVRERMVHRTGRGLWLMEGPAPADRPAGFKGPTDPRHWS